MTLKAVVDSLIQVDWSWDGERFDVVIDGDEESVTPFRRGHCDTVHRSIRVGDAFGICGLPFAVNNPSPSPFFLRGHLY